MKKFLPLTFYSFVCGIVTGTVVFLFKFLARKAEDLSRTIFSLAKNSLLFSILILVCIALFVLITFFLQKKIPECKGGGISKSKSIIKSNANVNGIKVLVGTFVGSLISFLSALGVGTEGPSVLMGTSVGSFFKRKGKEREYIMVSGASAGFAAATGAPLSALFFSAEEINKRFELPFIFVSSFAIISSTVTNRLLCRLFSLNSKLFLINNSAHFTWQQVTDLFFMAVVIAICVLLFDLITRLFDKIHFSFFKLPVIFILTALFAFYFDSVVYSGHRLTEAVLEKEFTLCMLLVILFLRMFFLVLVKRTGVTGGVFVPCLAIGALIGAITTHLLAFAGMNDSMFISLSLLGMCAFIGSVMKAPVMACVFYIELTGDLQSALYVFTVVFLTYALTEAIEKLLP